MDLPILARRPDTVLTTKTTCNLVDFVLPLEHGVKMKESKKIEKYLDLGRELKKTIGHKSDSDTNCCWSTWNGPQKPGKET